MTPQSAEVHHVLSWFTIRITLLVVVLGGGLLFASTKVSDHAAAINRGDAQAAATARRLSCRRGAIITLRNAEGWSAARERAQQTAAKGGPDAANNQRAADRYRRISLDLVERVVRCDLANPLPRTGPARQVIDLKFIEANRLPDDGLDLSALR